MAFKGVDKSPAASVPDLNRCIGTYRNAQVSNYTIDKQKKETIKEKKKYNAPPEAIIEASGENFTADTPRKCPRSKNLARYSSLSGFGGTGGGGGTGVGERSS